MALDTNDLAEGVGLIEAQPEKSAQANTPARSWKVVASNVREFLARWFSRDPLARFISASLWRRILVSNVLGLLGLMIGMLYLSLHHGWLLDAKVDVVKTLSRITAEAMAYRAANDNDRALFDPNRMPVHSQPRAQRDDSFSTLELPINPERAALIMKKLIGPTDLKARVYSPKGVLIIDSETLFSRTPVEHVTTDKPGDTPRLKNTWTRIHYWLINKELKVYREIGTANGFLYPEVKRAAQEGIETPILLLNAKGEQIVSMAEPIKRANKILGVLFLSTRPGEIDEILWDERALILQIATIALIASIISALLLSRTVAGPMSRLSEAANRVTHNISAGQNLPDFTERRDEVGQMGRAFKAMTSALYRRIEASEKFAADVAHELKNPLAAARSTAEALNYAKTDVDREELVHQIQSELKRLNRLINDVANASRLDAELARQEMGPVSVRSILDSVTQIFHDLLADDSRKMKLVIDPAAGESAYTVFGNDGRLGQVFTNLVDNALSFSPEKAVVVMRAKSIGQNVEIAVEDDGPGIPVDRLETIFERFYSDRPATDSQRGKNSGLGLSISREIITSHKGAIFAENRYDPNAPARPIGARFVVRLPVAGAQGGLIGRRV